MMVFVPRAPVLAAIRGNGVESFLPFYEVNSGTLRLSVTSFSCAVECLKRASSFDCIAQELSAWSLFIVSILVSRFHNFSFTVLYRCFNSCMSFLIYLSRSLSHLLPFLTSAVTFFCCPCQVEAIVQILVFIVSYLLFQNLSIFFAGFQFPIDLLQLCHQIVQFNRSCFFMDRCCPTFDLFVVMFGLFCYCRNCSKCFDLLGRLYHLLLRS